MAAGKVTSEFSNTEISSQTCKHGTERKLFEYQWPSTKEGEFFVLKGNAVSFLGVTSCFLKRSGKGMQNYNKIATILFYLSKK